MSFHLTVHLPRRRPTTVEVEVVLPERGQAPVRVEELRQRLADLLGEPVPFLCDEAGALDDGAVVGLPPLVHGVALRISPDRPAAHPRATEPAPLDLLVATGPDCGHRLPLGSGGLVLGRGPGADIVLGDRDLSRTHARLALSPAGPVVEDLGSTNGVTVDGRPVDRVALLTTTSRVRVGATTLRLAQPGRPRAPTTPQADGTVAVHRSARLQRPRSSAVVDEPDPPPPRTKARIPWLTALVPVAVAVVMALALGPRYLLMAAMSPLMVLGTALADRIGSGRSVRADRAAYAAAVVDRRTRLAELLAGEAARLEEDHPDPAEVLAIATERGHRLWERAGDAPDRLVLRVGVGSVPAATGWRPADGRRPVEHPDLADAPVTVDLAAVGVLGVVGDAEAALGVARALVGQLCVLNGPADLALRPEVPDSPEWAWLGWLPHAARAGHGIPEDEARGTVVLADLRGGRAMAEPLERLLAAAGDKDAAIVLAGSRTDLPAACRAVLDVGDGDRSTGSVQVDAAPEVAPVRVDRVGWWWSERLARALAPLREAPRAGDPTVTHPPALLDLLDLDATDPAAVGAAWEHGGEPTATLGMTADGPWRLGLGTDGPHALVGGMTGSGKSELLQALVASVAATSPPELVSFVLIDYKGGSAFAACAGLPHTVGLVTDLDEHLAARALTSLRAELTRRERLLATVGARDLEDHTARRGPADERLGRLVLVIDEFRLLAEELPDFVAGIVRIASVGRSLGVHLVLATQRPSGIVSPEIRANVNLRIALRVRDRADSLDVLESPDAASVPAARPGRGLARAGGGPLLRFQGARVSGRTCAPHTGLVVRLAGAQDSPPPLPTSDGPTDLDRIVTAVREAHRRRGGLAPRRPWLPPLPTALALDRPGPPRGDGVTVGLVDHPERQRQDPLGWNPGDGHWLVVGSTGSGRTTALRTIAVAASRTRSPDALEVYAVDAAGALRDLAALPHTGTVAGPDDAEVLERLLTRLEDEVRRRRRSGTAHGEATILLLVDGWERLAGADLLDGTVPERLTGVLREGQGVGLAAVVAGDRSLLVGRLTGLVSQTLLLRLADPVDAALAGVRRDAMPVDPPPGRAVRAQDGAELQLALASVEAAEGRPHRPSRSIRVRPLPGTVLLDELAGAAWTIGVGGDDATDLTLDPGRVGRLLLVCGAPGSGRSSALATFGRAALAAGRWVAVVDPRHGALAAGLAHAGTLVGRPVAVATAHEVDDLVVARRAHPDLVVLVDDADGLVDSPVDPVLREIAHLAERDGGVLAAATTPDAVLTQVRGVVIEVARRRRGLLLAPTGRGDGAAFGVAVPRGMPSRPGRGLLVAGGAPTRIQVALPWRDGPTAPG